MVILGFAASIGIGVGGSLLLRSRLLTKFSSRDPSHVTTATGDRHVAEMRMLFVLGGICFVSAIVIGATYILIELVDRSISD